MARAPYTRENMPVIDAKKPLTIRITKQDIAGANTKDPEQCVAARALKRQCKFDVAEVHLGRVFVRSNKGNIQRYMTPKSLRDELVAFDRGGQFETGEYTLIPPKGTQKLGYKKPTGPKKKRGKKRSYHVVKNVRPIA
jgi:hypothetical protein